MASSYPGSVGAFQVGSYFVKQYYQVLQQQPDFVHQFYTDDSSVVRIDGDSSESASALLQIHALTMSLNFTGIEIKTINSLESWNGGILVVVSGSVKSRDFNGWRKFVQTFFLAPQEKGYFVLNDLFHFVTEEEIVHHHHLHQHQLSVVSENRAYTQPPISSPLPESPVSDYALEETNEKLHSVHLEDEYPVDEYNIHEPQQQLPQHQEEEYTESEEESPLEESYGLPQNAVVAEQEPPPPVTEEFPSEPRKFTYASILQASKGKPVPSPVATTNPYRNKSTPAPATEWQQQPPQPTVQPTYVPPSTVEATDEGFSQDEAESKSVYVRNLPPTVSTFDLQQEFQKFGTIKPDGVFIRNRKEIGVCFAFVEFEDVEGVQNAIQASPIQLDDRQVYIEERRANSSGATRGGIGGRRGRGRGYPSEAPRGRYGGGGRSSGRGYQDGGDYRSRGNGVRAAY